MLSGLGINSIKIIIKLGKVYSEGKNINFIQYEDVTLYNTKNKAANELNRLKAFLLMFVADLSSTNLSRNFFHIYYTCSWNVLIIVAYQVYNMQKRFKLSSSFPGVGNFFEFYHSRKEWHLHKKKRKRIFLMNFNNFQ